MNSLLLTLLACSGLLACTGGGVTVDGPGDGDTPAPYIDPAIETEVPSLDVTTVQDAVDAVFQTLWDFQPQPVLAAYDAANADADGDCPLVFPDYNVDYGDAWYWSEPCTSDAGAAYAGFVYGVSFTDWAQDGATYTGGGMAAAGEVVDADGRVWKGSGTVYGYAGGTDDGSYLINALIMEGTWSWDGDNGSSWMSTGLEPGFNAYTTWVPAVGAGAVYIDGGLFGLEGELDTVVLDGFALYGEGLAPTCALEPSGTLSVRDVEGHWFDVTFDGPEQLEDPVNADWCDGCGGAWYEGSYVGEICLDFTSLLDWEERPW